MWAPFLATSAFFLTLRRLNVRRTILSSESTGEMPTWRTLLKNRKHNNLNLFWMIQCL
jgi:hypothetical protein